MLSLTTEFTTAALRIDLLFLDIFLQWYLFITSTEATDRHHRRFLKNQKHAHRQQRASEQKPNKQPPVYKLGR